MTKTTLRIFTDHIPDNLIERILDLLTEFLPETEFPRTLEGNFTKIKDYRDVLIKSMKKRNEKEFNNQDDKYGGSRELLPSKEFQNFERFIAITLAIKFQQLIGIKAKGDYSILILDRPILETDNRYPPCYSNSEAHQVILASTMNVSLDSKKHRLLHRNEIDIANKIFPYILQAILNNCHDKKCILYNAKNPSELNGIVENMKSCEDCKIKHFLLK